MGREWEYLERRNRRAQERPQRVIALGTAVAVAFLAWTHFFGEKRAPTTPAPGLEASILEAPVLEPPQVLETPINQYHIRPPARTGRESYVGVYECVVNGQRVVSDRPCAADAKTRTLVIDQPDPREVVRQREELSRAQQSVGGAYPTQSANAGSSLPGAGSSMSNEAACAAVDRAIENLNARMRQRYTAAEGERMRSQWHSLKRERYDLRCGR